MLFWVYICIAAYLTVIVVWEFFTERNWKKQVAYAMILIPFVLRVLLIK
jgi:hypothetical protein